MVEFLLDKFNVKSLLVIFFSLVFNLTTLSAQINFAQSELDFTGFGIVPQVTSLMYGPDGRLYVADYSGNIKILTVQRNGPADYAVVSMETLSFVKNIVNHDDDGSVNSGQTQRETTGLTVAGTVTNPVIYVTSSDYRIGSGPGGGNGDVGLDTNSGVITRISWKGGSWEVVDLVRGLPRSEENHATNGLEIVTINGREYLLVASGGITNGGSPSTNFVYTCEYALSGAILSVDLTALNSLPILNDGGRSFIYDLPTLDDPTRANVNGITDPDTAGYNGIDFNDPWGGNDGLNQAMVVPRGPVQIFSPGYRNAYDLVVTEGGALYVTDNGANQGWGGLPMNEGGGLVTNNYDPAEPGGDEGTAAPDGEYMNNVDHLQMVTTDLQSYSFGSHYAGHPNPVRANPSGAGLYTAPASVGTAGAVFRTLTYDPDGSTPGSTTDPNVALPANWPPVPVANIIEGDWRGPGVPNPDGPDNNPITTWGTNTNGIDEYTASNFGGVMKGNLLAGVNTGVLRRVELNPDGSLQQLTPSFLSGIGGNALGVTCNSDNEVFPGTIWAGTLGRKIVVFEPQDFVECTNPESEPFADYDSDGYTNQDELDNGTDPCNGGSQPSDFDKSAGGPFISDLNDTDDDADGILDANDPFQLGNPLTGGSDAFALPIQNGLFNDQQGLGGIFGLGLTGLMNNGDPNPNWREWLDDRGQGPNPDDVLGGATGLMTSHMTSGTANGSANTQEKGYQYGVQVDGSTGLFTVSGNLINFSGSLQLYGNTAAVEGELGLFIGDGTQSNFIKFVITTNGLTALQEIDDVPQAPINVPITVPNRPQSDVVFYFVVDPSNGKVDLEYALDGGSRTLAGTIFAQGSILNAIQQSGQDLAVGFIGTSNTPGVELEGTWDFLNVVASSPIIVQQLPDLVRIIETADEEIDLDNFFDDDNGVGNLTYSVETNTNPGIGASIVGGTLTVSYPSTPQSSDITVRATDTDNNFVEQAFTVTVTDRPIVLYRVNAGGPRIVSIDGDLDWGADELGNNSPYLSEPGNDKVTTPAINSYTSAVDLATTPTSIFQSERYDITPGPPNMTYSFPVTQNGNYEVRIYMGEGFSGASNAGDRVFDVEIEGFLYPELSSVDLSGTYGYQVGTMVSHIRNVTDGMIDITFKHGPKNNPTVIGIEILDASDTETPIYVHPIADQLSNTQEQLNGNFGVSALGGDGNLQFSASGLPPGVVIEPTNGQIGGTIDPDAATGSPYNVTVIVDDSDEITSDAVSINFIWEVIDAFSYRINAAGGEVTSMDIGPRWEDNSQTGVQNGNNYSVNTGAISNIGGIAFANRDISIPAYINQNIFNALFSEERFDQSVSPEMEYTINNLSNGDYVVNIYFANSFSGSSQPGQRVFDILLEGNIVKDNLDLITEFGHQIGGMLTFPISVTDGELNIAFGHEVQNPLVNAIEVFLVDQAFPTLILDPIADQNSDSSQQINFSTSASGGDTAESVSYYITGQPLGIDIDLNTGEISGTIDSEASTGGPNGDGVYTTRISAMKQGSAPANQFFTWTISPNGSLTWKDKSEDESYTARHECSFVQAGDKFYLMGGRENAKTLDIFDYNSNSWTSLVNSAPFEFNHFQAAEYQGLIWVIGAFKDNVFPNETPADYVWAFDPAMQEWIQGPEIPSGRKRGSTGLVVYNDKFYIVGGNTLGHNGGYVAWFDEYDPATGTWTSLADAPRARDHFHSTVIGDKLYSVGGRLSGGAGGTFKPVIPEVDVFDFVSGTWSTLPSSENLPTPRGAPAVANFNGKLVVIGGEVQNELVYGVNTNDALKITEEYDPATGTWTRLDDLNFERHGTQAIVSGNGIFVLAGSPGVGGGSQKNMEYYGLDAPVGNPSTPSTLSVPSTVVINDGNNEDININIIDGNVGIIVHSMEITGPDAADFSIISGTLTNGLLKPNNTHTLNISLSGIGENRNATLTINYGASSSININLTNNPDSALVVSNPGNQFNYEGDNISLQIQATSPNSNFSYSATGLPPNLSINSSTGVISGTISNTDVGGPFIEENGLVIIEAESGNIVPGWSVTNVGGTDGIIASSNHFGDQNGGTIPYDITISTPGVYRFSWRNYISGTSTSDNNDNWLRFPNSSDVWFFGQKNAGNDEASIISNLQGAQTDVVFPRGTSRISPSTTPDGASSNGYFKVYRGGPVQSYSWSSVTSDGDAHIIYIWFVNPGTYSMEISERSAGHAIDKIALVKVDGAHYTTAQLTAAPESNRTGIGGAAGNSPYAVEITVTDDGVPPLSDSIQFDWIIGRQGDLISVPEADIISGDIPLLVNFTGSNSLDDIGVTSYLWDFKDGTTSTEADPIKTFTATGTYDVALTVGDDDGNTSTNSITINVSSAGNQSPVAVASSDVTSGDAPLTVAFTGSGSTDDVGIASYLWEFGDLAGSTSTDADTSFEFMEAGVYTVTLTVTDDDGLTNSTTLEITVNTPNGAPVAVASSDVTSGDAPLTVAFTGSNSTDDVGIAGYLWEFGDVAGSTSTEADPSFEFTDVGVYTVTLTVTDDDGLANSTTLEITVNTPNGAPVAVASSDVTSGDAPLTVAFTGSNSTDDVGIASYLWEFGDVAGSTSTEADPSFEFMEAGVYTVTLTVTDDDGLTNSTTLEITVNTPNGSPVAVASSDVTSGDAPLTVAFTGSGSTDDVGIAGYLWEFGDVAGSTSTEGDPSFEFTDAGVYTVTLTVTDDDGLTDSTTLEITVNTPNGAPVAVASSDVTSGDAPLTVAFTGSNSTDDVGIASYLWEFGDVAGSTSTEADPSFEFTDAGVYTVTLTVTDDDGLANSTTLEITVNTPNGAPVAVVSSDVTSGDAPLTVAFTGSNSTDDVGIASYLWEFGDLAGSTSTDADTSFEFMEAGVYTVTLTVTDDDGLANSTTLEITVNTPNGAPVAVASSDVSSGDAPLAVTFTGSGSTDDVGIAGYLWEFGDVAGSTSTDADPSFEFTDAGVYTVTLTVTDDGDLTDSTTLEITVNDPVDPNNEAPVAAITANPINGIAPLPVLFSAENATDDKGIVLYEWDFNDGTTSTIRPNSAAFSHTFAQAGTYQVVLTVTDEEGLTGTATITITVSETNVAPNAVASATPLEGSAPLEVTFDGSASTDDIGIVSYSWDFGDGTSSDEASPSHTYGFAGEFDVVLTVSDGEFTDTAELKIVVFDNVPTEVGSFEAIVAPNPIVDGVANIIMVSEPIDDFITLVYLHDASGRYISGHLAQTIYDAGNYKIPTYSLRSGIYFVTLLTEKGEALGLKIMVNN